MLLLPFGLDRFAWVLMGQGIQLVDHVASFTSDLPHAAIDLPSMPVPALVTFSLGGLWLCLWKRSWRLIGLAGMAGGLLIAVLHRPPDLLVSADGRNVAARTAAGALAFAGPESRGGASLRASWAKLAGEGDSLPAWPTANVCTDFACRWQVAGRTVILARRRGADCAQAALVLAAAPGATCTGLTIDYTRLRQGGNLAVWLASDAIRMESVTDWQGDRPWRRPETPVPAARRVADALR
jgi:competence protein ComEC